MITAKKINMSYKTKFNICIVTILLTLLYFFPKTTIVIGVILIIIWNSNGGSDDYSKKQRWIKPYMRKDGTRVEGHWKGK